MNVWAKISSISIMLAVIYVIYLGISFIELSTDSQFISLGTTTFFALSILSSVVFMLIFYSPLFYFGWIKRPKNEIMKMWAKVLTIIFPVLAVISFISPWGLEFPKNILSIIPAFLLIIPLYYYAWRD